MRKSVTLIIILQCCFAFPTVAEPLSMAKRPVVQSYIDEVVRDHAFDRAWLLELFEQIHRQQSVIDRISKPAEKVLRWYQYRAIFLTDKRIKDGVKFIQEHAEILARVEAEFQIPAEVIASIIGVETFYGTYTGKDKSLAALATLAFDYPPRASFFRREMTELLLLAREERLDPLAIRGSYAAAMGMPQFIASSYRRYAVDFDEDGRRDLWSSKGDIIASVANYFKQHGWRSNEAIVERVFPSHKSYKTLIYKELKPKVNVDRLQGTGIEPSFDVKDAVSVMDFKLEDSTQTWLGYHNFYVITRYNHSRLYAMAVYQLSEALKNAGA